MKVDLNVNELGELVESFDIDELEEKYGYVDKHYRSAFHKICKAYNAELEKIKPTVNKGI
tara:strand:+ start:66 stop:245 length:180 start_codon:yes stop_codon:yes gene_type:complete